MTYWDSSAIVALLVNQRKSDVLRELVVADPLLCTWALSEVEIHSALCRLNRDGNISDIQLQQALENTDRLMQGADRVVNISAVTKSAKRATRVHGLKAADAMQLAAALVLNSSDGAGKRFVCLDKQLVQAAAKEGFSIKP